jgi:hypothetical protein
MAAAAAASEVRVASRRIVDYLNDGEELGVEGAGAEAPPCTPAAAGQGARSVRPGSVLPRFRWPRLVSLGRKGGAAKGKGKEVVVVEKGDDPPRAGSTSGACAWLRCATRQRCHCLAKSYKSIALSKIEPLFSK